VANENATLGDLLGSDGVRGAVIDDACTVLDQEVGDKGGLGGIAIKGAYSIVKGIQPGFVREVVDGLLDDFLDALDPIYQDAKTQGRPAGQHLAANADSMAEKLLGITDQRAERSSRAVIRKTYAKLRPTAKKHVMAAAPRLGALLDRRLPS
jgi:hypothetical protein